MHMVRQSEVWFFIGGIMCEAIAVLVDLIRHQYYIQIV